MLRCVTKTQNFAPAAHLQPPTYELHLNLPTYESHPSPPSQFLLDESLSQRVHLYLFSVRSYWQKSAASSLGVLLSKHVFKKCISGTQEFILSQIRR